MLQPNRRLVLALVPFLVFAALACSKNTSPPATTQPSQPEGGAPQLPTGEQPNFILILSDDQDAASWADMPNLQRLLVAQGT